MGVIWLRVVPAVLGFVLVVTGAALWSVPVALVVAGVMLMAAAFVDVGDDTE